MEVEIFSVTLQFEERVAINMIPEYLWTKRILITAYI